MGMNDAFAVFILTHGRPQRQITYRMLRRQGYTGAIYLIIDNEDKLADEYYRLYGDQVIMFDKPAIANSIDEGDNFKDRRAIIYARNASYDIAKGLGLDYFLQLDDDYRSLFYEFDSALRYCPRPVKNLDRLFSLILEFYQSIPALTVALGQAGDIIGGEQGGEVAEIKMKRKAMNSFFCSTKRPIAFAGRINEDVNTYVLQGHRGDLFLTFFYTIIQQETTQQNSGGMTELYLDSGTYLKSFYTVMYAPSCVKIAEMGKLHRLHHLIHWDHAVPCILHERFRKSDPLALEQ